MNSSVQSSAGGKSWLTRQKLVALILARMRCDSEIGLAGVQGGNGERICFLHNTVYKYSIALFAQEVKCRAINYGAT